MTPQNQDIWPVRPFLLVGFAALFVLIFGLGGWSALARISGAVIASGTVEVEGNRQVVQHPVGGVIAEILARDGDVVEAGDVLIRFDGESMKAELAIVEGQLFEIIARKNRLAAERDGKEAITFDPEIVRLAATRKDIVTLIADQTLQFETGLHALGEETQQLGERKVQIGNQNEGLAAQRRATDTQAELLGREVKTQETLLAQGLTREAQVLALKRELARLDGVTGQIDAALAENRAKVAEIEIEILRLTTTRREKAISELRDLEFREIELRERRGVLREDISRLDLRAPVAGVVYGSTVDTLRGVVRAAEPILFIVPQNVPLIVRTRVDPIHIDEVRVGQTATLRFSGFNSRTTPEVDGDVIAVSADAIKDERLDQTYYRADVRLAPGEKAKLGDLTLMPGMPVTAFIKTDDRTPLSYFVRPFVDYFNKAFRET